MIITADGQTFRTAWVGYWHAEGTIYLGSSASRFVLLYYTKVEHIGQIIRSHDRGCAPNAALIATNFDLSPKACVQFETCLKVLYPVGTWRPKVCKLLGYQFSGGGAQQYGTTTVRSSDARVIYIQVLTL